MERKTRARTSNGSRSRITNVVGIVFILIMSLVVLLCACGRKEAEEPDSTPVASATLPPTEEPVETAAPTFEPVETAEPHVLDEQAEELCDHMYRATVVRPTCTDVGFTEYECRICGDIYRDNFVGVVGHTYAENVVPATASSYGYTMHVCSRCGDSYRDDYTDPTGAGAHIHTWEVVEKVEATCTAQGYTIYRCAADGETKRDDYVYPLGHNYQRTETHPVTCTERGYNVYTCSRCQETYTADIVQPSGHTYVDTVVPPTCTENGYTLHTCGVCQYSYTDAETLATGHSYAYTSHVDASCEGQGYDLYTCSSCGETERRAIVEPLGHDYKYSTSVNATCTAGGYDVYACSRCGATKNTTTSGALGHSLQTREREATCTEPGFRNVTCLRCGAVIEQSTTPALGHNMVLDHHVDSTCNGSGYDLYKCTRCDVTEQQNVVDPDPSLHQPGEWIYVAATCVDPGYRELRCTVCDQILEHVITTQPNGSHDYVEQSRTDATCTEPGKIEYACSRCGATMSETIEAKGHLWHMKDFKFENDHTLFSATLSCERCDTVEENVQGSVTALHVPATEDELEHTVYTGTVEKDGQTLSITDTVYSQKPTVPPHDHAYSADDVSFSWDGVESCTATFACTVCGEKVDVVCSISGPVHTDATCGDNAKDTYTATANIGDVQATDTKVVEEEDSAPGYHNWGTTQDGAEYSITASMSEDYKTFSFKAKCLVCGKTEVIATVPAVLDETRSTEPTCFAAGKSVFTGSLDMTFPISKTQNKHITASARSGEITVPHLEHIGSTTVTKAPTCTEPGTQTINCERPCCQGKTITEEIPALGHKFATPTEDDFTWTDNYTKATVVLHCTNAGCPEAEKEYPCTVKAEEGEYVDCDTPVTSTYTATVTVDDGIGQWEFSATKTVYVPAGHITTKDPESIEWADDYSSLTVKYYCTREGCAHDKSSGDPLVYTTDEITSSVIDEGDCEHGKQTKYTATIEVGNSSREFTRTVTAEPEGHDYQEDFVDEASCTEPGTRHLKCSKCGALKDEEIKPLGHSWTAEAKDFSWNDDHTTCDVTIHCERCSESKSVAAKVSSKVTTPADCTHDEMTTYTATVEEDGVTITGEVEVKTNDKTGHSWSKTKDVPATCTEPNYELWTCSTCRTTEHRNEGSPLGHKYDPQTHLCSQCNRLDVDEIAKAVEDYAVNEKSFKKGSASATDYYVSYADNFEDAVNDGKELVDGIYDDLTRNGNSPSNVTIDVVDQGDSYKITMYYDYRTS